MVEIVLENGLEKKLAVVSLWNSSVQMMISDIAIDVKDQLMKMIKSTALGLL